MTLRAAMIGAMMTLASPLAANPPSVPGVDAPELAALGQHSVGFRTLTFVHRLQPDFQAVEQASTPVPLKDRPLTVSLWYPAAATDAQRTTYTASFWGEPPKPPVAYTVPGLARRDAPAVGTKHPLVIVSHGYSNAPAAMSWLTENLASKGYVVAAIHHDDPNPYMISADKRAAPNYHRPLDIAFVAAELKARLGAQIDPDRIALVGFSQGGYGVITAGGASLDPDGPNMALVAGGLLKRFARGAEKAADIRVPGVKAIVALAPAGGGPVGAWGAAGLADITAPLLLIAGEFDATVGYNRAAKAFFEGAVNSDRVLLTYKQAGHAIGLNPAPPEMRTGLWDLDWFEDPVWRTDRVNTINQHFITAFLDLHLRGQAEKRSYLEVAVDSSNEGTWTAPADTPWSAYSPGGPGITLWKGFQRSHARGLELRHLGAAKR